MTLRSPSGSETGGYGATRAHRLVRRTLLPLVLVAMAGGTSGCSTKADVRDIRDDMSRLEARQDSIFRLLLMQNREILDSLTLTTEQLLNVRGELTRQLSQVEQQLVQVGELTGQVQIRLNRLDQQLAQSIQALSAGGAVPDGSEDATPGDEGQTYDEARTIYSAGLEQVDRGNAGTARRAFQMVVDQFPDHAVAAEAQRQVGETYAMEGQYEEALRAFDRVVERYQDSDAAPRALYRAGVIAQERGQADRARQYFQRVVSAYPSSDARRLAEDALSRM